MFDRQTGELAHCLHELSVVRRERVGLRLAYVLIVLGSLGLILAVIFLLPKYLAV
jgi:hypothetical protein